MSYSPYLSAYKGPEQNFLTWNQVPNYPFHNYFRNNPLNPTTTIDPRRGGYRPYGSGVKVSDVTNLDNPCEVYTLSCDIILPVNKCYAENPVIVTQP